MSPAEDADVTLSLIGIATAGLTVWRWGLPRWRKRMQRRRDMEDAILGRDPEPGNRVTGEGGKPALLPLGDRLAAMDQKQEYLIAKVHENSEQQKQLDRIESRLARGDERMDHIESDLAALKAQGDA